HEHILSSFLCTDPPPAEIYTLSLHDALPISAALTACVSGAGCLTSKPAENMRGEPVISMGRGSARAPAITIVMYLSISTVKAFTDRKSTRLNSSHVKISYAVFCLKKKKNKQK